MSHFLFTSITRTSGLDARRFDVSARPRRTWKEGDFVVGAIAREAAGPAKIELPTGRLVDAVPGDLVVGCLGTRAATLAYCGSYRELGEDGRMELLTAGGVLGRVTSKSTLAPAPAELDYQGHVTVEGEPANLEDYALSNAGGGVRVPVALIIGTSMDAGKTLAGRTIIRRATRVGARVFGAKLSGVGRVKDILAMSDAGAVRTFDFVDAGLPSTVTDPKRVARMIDTIFSHIPPEDCDLCVVEAGASPLEPYNGDVVYEWLRPSIAFTVLCASDPYAVAGVRTAFGFSPDIVAGRAAGTSAARDLVKTLTGDDAVDIVDPDQVGIVDKLLLRAGIDTRRG